jgi:hypothetical protein
MSEGDASIQAHDRSVGHHFTAAVRARRQQRKVALFERFQMDTRDLGFFADLLQRDAALLASAPQEFAEGGGFSRRVRKGAAVVERS